MWVERNPSFMEYVEAILPYYGPKDSNPHVDRSETIPHMKRNQSRNSISTLVRQNSIDAYGDGSSNGSCNGSATGKCIAISVTIAVTISTDTTNHTTQQTILCTQQ